VKEKHDRTEQAPGIHSHLLHHHNDDSARRCGKTALINTFKCKFRFRGGPGIQAIGDLNSGEQNSCEVRVPDKPGGSRKRAARCFWLVFAAGGGYNYC